MSKEILVAYLNSQVVISAQGKDCERYLNNRLSNDVKSLQIGAGVFAAALSVQGKADAFIYVLRTSAQSYLLLSDGGDAANIIQAVSRFKVRDDIKFQEQSSDFQVVHIGSFDAQQNSILCTELEQKLRDKENIYLQKRIRFGFKGLDIICSKLSSTIETILADISGYLQISEQEQNLLRLKAFIPKFPEDIGPDFLIQESGLTKAYSITKGCYVGQEVIQKIASFAQAPGKLLGFKVPGNHDSKEIPSLESGTAQKIGTILSNVFDTATNHTYGLIRVNSKFISSPQEMKGFLGEDMISFSNVFDYSVI